MNGGPKTVVYVLDSLGLSGRTKGIIDLALNLTPGRYRPSFIAFDAEDSPLIERLRRLDVPIDYVTMRKGLRPDNVFKLGARLRKLDAHVVHAVNPRPMLYAGMAARVLGIRSAVGSLSAFACQVPDREYRFLPFDLVNRGPKQALRNQVACRLMRRVVAVSKELGERFCRFTADGVRPFGLLGYQALARKMRAISYGIDLAPYVAVSDAQIAEVRALCGAGPETVLVGSVGRLVEQKDYPTQIAAFAQAAKNEPRLRMVLAGDGPLRPEIDAQLLTLGISDRVTFLGHWTRVPELLRALDVFVIASKFEPYGVALLEAKCAGAAIVATAVNEIPTLIADGETGLVVPPEAPEPMAAAFSRLAADAAVRRSLGERALAEATRRHSIEAVATAYQALYDEGLS